MKFTYVLFGLVVGVVFGLVFANVDSVTYIAWFKDQFVFLVSATLVLMAAVVVIYLFQKKITKFLFGVSATSLEEASHNIASLIDEIVKRDSEKLQDRVKRIIPELIGLYSTWAFRAWVFRTVFGLLVVMAGSFGTYVLVRQTEAIDKQTDQLAAQQELLQQQVALMKLEARSGQIQILQQEASRRSSFAPTVASTIEGIASGRYIEKLGEENDDPTRNLSPDFAYQLFSFLQLLNPYQILEPASLDVGSFDLETFQAKTKYVSPERGQILQTLLTFGYGASLGTDGSLNFSYADMRGFSAVNYIPDGADECQTSESEYLYDISRFDIRNTDFRDSELTSFRLDLWEGENFSNAKLYFSTVVIREQNSNIKLSGLQLHYTRLEIMGNNVDLHNVKFYFDAPGCITLYAGVESATAQHNSVLDGLTIVLDPAKYAQITEAEWHNYLFGTYIEHNASIVPENYTVRIKQKEPDQDQDFPELHLTLEYVGQ